ncbi:MAG: MoaD/ThiS family protein [Bacillota bacterium]|nr:MoaD/ThiS family protein [Bacillota bacterium]
MKVSVKVVGPLAQYYPAGEGEVELPEGARAAQLIETLELPRFPPVVVVVNDRRAGEDVILRAGDRVALLWPAGGG